LTARDKTAVYVPTERFIPNDTDYAFEGTGCLKSVLADVAELSKGFRGVRWVDE